MKKEISENMFYVILALLIFALMVFIMIYYETIQGRGESYTFKPQIHEEYRVSIVDKEMNGALETYETYNGYLIRYYKYRNGNVEVYFRYYDNDGIEHTKTLTLKNGDKIYFILEENTYYEIGD